MNLRYAWLLVAAVACGEPTPDAGSLARQLASTDATQREAAADGLALLGPAAEPALRALSQTILDPEPAVRLAAVRALTGIGGPARRSLAIALNDGDPKVRTAAARGLLALGPDASESIASLIAVLADDATEVAEAARAALVAIGPDATNALVRVLVLGPKRARPHAAVALVALGEPAVDGLIEAVAAPLPEARKAAIAALATMVESMDPPPALAPALAKAFNDTDPEVAAAARKLHGRVTRR